MSVNDPQSEAALILYQGNWENEDPTKPEKPDIVEVRGGGYQVEDLLLFHRAIFLSETDFVQNYEAGMRRQSQRVVQNRDTYFCRIQSNEYSDLIEIRENCRQICRDYSRGDYPKVSEVAHPEFMVEGKIEQPEETLFYVDGTIVLQQGGLSG